MHNKTHIFLLPLLFFCFSCQSDKPKNNPVSKDNLLVNNTDWKAYKAKHIALRGKLGNAKAEIQTFNINPEKDTVVVSKHGSLLFIPENNFSDSKGYTVTKPLQVSLIELPDSKIAALNGMSTITDKGDLLETNGMYYIEVSIAGAEEKLTYKNPIRVEIQSSIALPELQSFDGVWKGDNLVWDSKSRAFAKDMTPISILALVNNNNVIKTDDYKNQDFNNASLINSLLLKDSSSYKHSWIATQEFNARLSCIMKCCKDDLNVFNIYTKNNNKMLWEADELVAEFLEKAENPQAINFRKFAKMRNTKLRNSRPLPQNIIKEVHGKYKNQKQTDETSADKKSKQKTAGNLSAWLNYPIAFTMETDGWVNMDSFYEDIRKLGQDNPEFTIVSKFKIKCRLLKSNQFSNKEFDLVVFAKGLSSGFNLNRDKDDYSFGFTNFPNAQFLILARSKDGEKLGFLEAMPKDGEAYYDLSLKATDDNAAIEEKVGQYLLPRESISFSQTIYKTCHPELRGK